MASSKKCPRTGKTRLWVELKCGHFDTIHESRSGMDWNVGVHCTICDTQRQIIGMEGPKGLQDMFRF